VAWVREGYGWDKKLQVRKGPGWTICPVGGYRGWREPVVSINGSRVRCAVPLCLPPISQDAFANFLAKAAVSPQELLPET
jgi:hypothetical protein